MYFTNFEFYKFYILEIFYFTNFIFYKFYIVQIWYLTNILFYKFYILKILYFIFYKFSFYKFYILQILYCANFIFYKFYILQILYFTDFLFYKFFFYKFFILQILYCTNFTFYKFYILQNFIFKQNFIFYTTLFPLNLSSFIHYPLYFCYIYSCDNFYSSCRCQTFGERMENMFIDQNFGSAVSYSMPPKNIWRQDEGSTASSCPFHRCNVSLHSGCPILNFCGGEKNYIIGFRNSSYFPKCVNTPGLKEN